MKLLLARLAALLQRALDALFQPISGPFSRWVHAAVLSGLYLLGVWLWGGFFSWGEIPFDFLDWAEVTGPRIALLRSAAEQGVLPLHAASTASLRGVTDRYLSIADTPFSPQYLMLARGMWLGRYVFYDTLLFYTLGFAGLALLARRYRLAPAVVGLLFLLFNLNGYITGHLAVGHSIWTGYFLLPFFVLLVLQLVERGQAGWRWVLGMAVLLLAILLQGFFHLYLWCLMFLGLLALFRPRLWRPIALGGLAAVLVALPRLLPPALALPGITQEYLGGFGSLADLIASMIVLRDPYNAQFVLSQTFPVNVWEVDYYLGLLGFAFVLVFGVWAAARAARSGASPYLPVLAAGLILGVLSIGRVYAWLLNVLPVPPLTAERVTSRMFILPLVFLLVLAAIHAQRFWNEQAGSPGLRLLALGGIALAFHDLNQHLQAWRIRAIEGMVHLYPKVPFDRAQHVIANHADPAYTNLLVGGGIVALLALAVLVVLALRERGATR